MVFPNNRSLRGSRSFRSSQLVRQPDAGIEIVLLSIEQRSVGITRLTRRQDFTLFGNSGLMDWMPLSGTTSAPADGL